MDDCLESQCSSTSLTSSGLDASSNAEVADDESTESNKQVISLLDRLQSPQPSSLARKRKIATNNPPVGRKRSKGRSSHDPPSVTPLQRVRSYPNEPFKVSNNKIFCMGCREELSAKKSTLDLHIKSNKHIKNKEKLKSRERSESDIADSLRKYSSQIHPKGESLPDSTRVYRVKVVTALLKAGIPLNKSDFLRELLEENGYSLTDSSHLRELIPYILSQEISKLKEEIGGKHVSIIFDGTTHVCEAFVLVVQYIQDWQIKQKVCRLMLLAKSVNGKEVARQLITVLQSELSVPPNLVIAAMRDRASVNNVAIRTVGVIYDKLMDVGCFSHTLDHVGENMVTPILDEFIKVWISLFSRNPKSRLAWKSQTGSAIRTYSSTRWWSKFEVIHQLHDLFGDVSTFVRNEDLPKTTTNKLILVLDDPPSCRKLKIELAVTVESMQPFVKATYNLEGDGPLILTAYNEIRSLFAHVQLAYHPNVQAVARELAQGNASHETLLLSYAAACYEPAYAYFEEKFSNDLANVVEAFKAARYFLPDKVIELNPSSSDIDSLSSFPFIDSELISGLKVELPYYIAEADGVSNVEPLSWWRVQSEAGRLSSWTQALKLVLLVQPSSAAAERVFSILNDCFNHKQESALEDYVQLSVMLQYNYRN